MSERQITQIDKRSQSTTCHSSRMNTLPTL